MLGRVIRDIQRKSGQLQLPAKEQTRLAKLLQIARRIHSQQRVRAEGEPPKIYSVHAPEAECIAKGKADKQYEFGVKVGLVTTSKESFVLAAASLAGNPYDGHTLKQCLDQAKRCSQAWPLAKCLWTRATKVTAAPRMSARCLSRVPSGESHQRSTND